MKHCRDTKPVLTSVTRRPALTCLGIWGGWFLALAVWAFPISERRARTSQDGFNATAQLNDRDASHNLGDVYRHKAEDGSEVAVNSKTYQLISPGRDGRYGKGRLIDETPSHKDDFDNFTNFAPGTLGPVSKPSNWWRDHLRLMLFVLGTTGVFVVVAIRFQDSTREQLHQSRIQTTLITNILWMIAITLSLGCFGGLLFSGCHVVINSAMH